MKKFNLSLVAVLAMSTFAVAGGDIAPVVEPVVTDSGFYLGGGYGYMDASRVESFDYQNDERGQGNDNGSDSFTHFDDGYNELLLLAGYKFNSYVAIEGRYWYGLDTSISLAKDLYDDVSGGDVGIDAWGIYVKPMYPITDAFDIYALLGYASAEAKVSYYDSYTGDFYSSKSDSVNGFSWGIGASYSFTNSLSIFVDYVNIYDDKEDLQNSTYNDGDDDYLISNHEIEDTISTINFGVTYQF